MRELVFGDAVGSTWFFHFSTDGRLGAIHLGDRGVVHNGAGPRETGRVGIPPLWITEISLVFMARPPLSMVVYWFHRTGSMFPEGARVSFGNISGTLSPHSRNLGLDACSSVT